MVARRLIHCALLVAVGSLMIAPTVYQPHRRAAFVSQGGGATLPLDAVEGAYAGYSVARRLDAQYAGSAFRVRRASDAAEQDIGFSGDDVDISALATFCSGTDGFVVTIYDQTGNARDVTMATTTRQPQIVSSGSVLTDDNGFPVAVFDGTDDTLTISGQTVSLPVTHISVIANNSMVSSDVLFAFGGTTRGTLKQLQTPAVMRINSGSNLNERYGQKLWMAGGLARWAVKVKLLCF